MSALVLPAPAKLNLCLKVLGRREDGYHELQTAFQLIDLCDTITLEVAPDLVFQTEGSVPGEQNLVMQAARRLREHTG